MKYTPHAYQQEAIKFCIQRGAAGLFLDPGLGKTSIILGAFQVLKRKGLVENMLVIAPLRPAYSVWPAEVQKWDEFKDLKIVVLHGPNKDSLLCSDADIFVINPAGLDWLFKSMEGAPGWWDILVVDESTQFKHSNTKRFKTLKKYLPKFKRRYILTGSPAPNGLLDLFGQVYILDLGNALGRFITHYRNNYFDTPYIGSFVWYPRPNAPAEIYRKLQPLVLRMSEQDYLTLPPLINNTVEVELEPAALKAYYQMEVALAAEIEQNLIVAVNAAVASSKCRQIANGGIFHEGGEEWSNIHTAKSGAVAEIVEELSGKPCLVAYEFRHDLERLRAIFPEAPIIGGGVPPHRFREIERAWNSGTIPVLLAQPQSVAHGLNLQGTGAAVIFHSIPWDLEVYEQLVRRVWRQGQKDRVVVHHIVAKGTIDEVIMQTLGKKTKTQQALLDALKSHLRRQ